MTLARTRRLLRGEAGFTLLELVIALFVLGFVGNAFVKTVADEIRQSTERRERRLAEEIARNEAERLEITSPWTAPATSTYAVDRTGSPDPDGPYEITITRSVTCDGGPMLVDNAAAPPPSMGCTTQRPLARFTVTVRFPSTQSTPSGPSPPDSVQHHVSVAPIGRYTNLWAPALDP